MNRYLSRRLSRIKQILFLIIIITSIILTLMNGDHLISPKDWSALARLKYFTSVTQKISEKNYAISYRYKIVLNVLNKV